MGAILGLCGLIAAVVGAWRGYAVARQAIAPLVHGGDPTRTAIEATRPILERPRVRLVFRRAGDLDRLDRDRALRPVPRRSSAWSWARERRRRAAVRRPRALRGGHRDRGPLPAPDPEQDVLRLLDGLRRRPAEHPHVPGLPGPARRPPHDQPAGRRARADDRDRDRRDHPAGDPLGSQELLLPGPSEGLPDQPVRPAARGGGLAHVRHVQRAGDHPDHPGPPRGGHRQAHPCHGRRRQPGQPRRLQPLRCAAHGDRHRARCPLGRGRPALRRGAAACSCARSGCRTRTWSVARCGSRPTSRSGRGARSRSGRGSRSRT